MSTAITKDFILKLFHYDSEAGKLIWKNHWTFAGFQKFVGKEAGSIDKGYRRIAFSNVYLGVHQIIWFLERGFWADNVDHINGITLDNRISNLRDTNIRLNQSNRHYHREGKLVGASFSKKNQKWVSQITINYKCITLGYFNTELEAHIRYLDEIKKNLNLVLPKDRDVKIQIKEREDAGISKYVTKKYICRKPWRARVKIKNKEIFLGYYKTKEEAIKARKDYMDKVGLL